MDRESKAANKFSCSTKERCFFECGIKLATIYHQFVGTPFNKSNIKSLEKAIEDAILVQPYVIKCSIKIDESYIPKEVDEYSYTSLTGNMIDATVSIKIDDITVTSEMRFDKELNYPLMFVSRIE